MSQQKDSLMGEQILAPKSVGDWGTLSAFPGHQISSTSVDQVPTMYQCTRQELRQSGGLRCGVRCALCSPQEDWVDSYVNEQRQSGVIKVTWHWGRLHEGADIALGLKNEQHSWGRACASARRWKTAFVKTFQTEADSMVGCLQGTITKGSLSLYLVDSVWDIFVAVKVVERQGLYEALKSSQTGDNEGSDQDRDQEYLLQGVEERADSRMDVKLLA